VLRALDEADIPIDLVVGTSGGAIIGALYAGGYTGAEIAEIAISVSPWSFVDLAISDYGYISGGALERFVRASLDNRRIEQLKIPFAAVTTHVESGTQETFNRGDTATAVRASAAIPGVFLPVRIEGEHYVDGELVSPVPIRTARKLGAEIVIAVDVMAKLEEAPTLPRYPMEWLIYGALRRSIVDLELDELTVVVQPPLDYYAGMSEAWRRRAIDFGYIAGQKAVKRIRELIEEGTVDKKQAFRRGPAAIAVLR
jgi:NTE family protein